jgi:hypothetical protein
MDSERDMSEKTASDPLPIDPEERLDWDFDIGERPPSTRKWRVKVQLRHKVAQPLPLSDPDEE